MKDNWRKKMLSFVLYLSSPLQDKGEGVEIARTLSEAKNLLLCLPEKLEDFAVAKEFLPLFRNSFTDSAITLLLRREYKSFLRKHTPFGCVWVGQEDLTFLGLPKKNLVSQIQMLNFDVAVDLGPEFDPLSAYLCRLSKAKLRISMVKPRGNHFFNLQIRTKSTGDLSESYKNLIRYLGASC